MKKEYCLNNGKLCYIDVRGNYVPVRRKKFELKSEYESARVVNLQNKFGVYMSSGKNANTGIACNNVIPVGDYLIFHNNNGVHTVLYARQKV